MDPRKVIEVIGDHSHDVSKCEQPVPRPCDKCMYLLPNSDTIPTPRNNDMARAIQVKFRSMIWPSPSLIDSWNLEALFQIQ